MIFLQESSITKFFKWAETAQEPMRSYSIGILAFIMEGQEHASTFKDSNHKLVSFINNSSFGIEERLLIVLASKYDDLDEV